MSDDTPGTDTTDAGSSSIVSGAQAGDAPPSNADGGTPDGTGTNDNADTKPEGAPEAYADFTLPEGLTLADETLNALKDFAKGKNLPQSDAQAMVDVLVQHHTRAVETATQAFTQASEEWAAACRADKDFGGANFDDSVAAIGHVMQEFGDQELRDVLNTSHLGNHPALFRFIAKVGKAIGERPLDGGGSGQGTGAGAGVPPMAERFYPTKAA